MLKMNMKVCDSCGKTINYALHLCDPEERAEYQANQLYEIGLQSMVKFVDSVGKYSPAALDLLQKRLARPESNEREQILRGLLEAKLRELKTRN